MEEETNAKAGLADAMAKILGKKVPSKGIILAKSKTDREIAKKRVKEKVEKGIDDEETRENKAQEQYVAALEKVCTFVSLSLEKVCAFVSLSLGKVMYIYKLITRKGNVHL